METVLSAQAEEVSGARWFTLEEALAAGVDASLARALRKAGKLLGADSGRPRVPGPLEA
jgi:hypothetical protein